jgi:hypothetical protein
MMKHIFLSVLTASVLFYGSAQASDYLGYGPVLCSPCYPTVRAYAQAQIYARGYAYPAYAYPAYTPAYAYVPVVTYRVVPAPAPAYYVPPQPVYYNMPAYPFIGPICPW